MLAQCFYEGTMFCHQCGNKNREDAKFCRYCGANVHGSAPVSFVEQHGRGVVSSKILLTIKYYTNLFLYGVVNLLKREKKIGRKIIYAAVVSLVFLMPFALSAYKVYAAMSKAHTQEASGEFQAALSTLQDVKDSWFAPFQKSALFNAIASEEQNISSKQTFDEAKSKQKEGKLNDAKKLLQSIPEEYAGHKEVERALLEISDAQVSQSEADRQAALTAQHNAEIKASSEAAAKAQAQADAQAAQQAKEEADAAAASAAAQAQQEAAKRTQQTQISFKNQLTSIVNSMTSGLSYFSEGLDSAVNGDSIVAIAQLGQARAVFSTAYSSTVNLRSSFTGMPTAYIQASLNLLNATTYCLSAASKLSSLIAGSNDDPRSDYANCTSYLGYVKTFLSSY